MSTKLSALYHQLSKKDQTPNFLAEDYLPSLDGWRAIGVMMVILGHAKLTKDVPETVHLILDKVIYAELGVQIFFVLSGFLITIILIKTKKRLKVVSLKEFYLKRALRILPVFYLYLLVLFILNTLIQLNLNWQNFTGPLLFVNNFNFFPETWLTGHTWSLAVEEQFYFLWPLAFIFLPNKGWLLSATIIFLNIFLNIFWYLKPQFYALTLGPFVSHADALLTGCLGAILCFKGLINGRHRIWFNWYVPFLAAIIILLIYHYYLLELLQPLLVPFGSLLTNTLIMFLIIQSLIYRNSLLFKVLNLPFVKEIGVLSYSLYIWQQLFLAPKEFNVAIFWNVFPYNILFAFVAAYFSYHYFEKHFLKIKDKLKKKHHTKCQNINTVEGL